MGSEPTRVSELSGRLSAANEKQPGSGTHGQSRLVRTWDPAIRETRGRRAPKLQLGRVFKPRVPGGFPGLPEKLRDRQRTSPAEAGQCCANMMSSRPCRFHDRVNNGRRPGDGITMQSHFTSLARGEGVALEVPKQANRLLAHGAH